MGEARELLILDENPEDREEADDEAEEEEKVDTSCGLVDSSLFPLPV